MKKCLMILLTVLLLCGCSAVEAPEPAAPAAAQTQQTESVQLPPETQPPETQPPETQPRDPVEELLKTMTVPEKIGQIFLVRCPEERAAAEAEACFVGGFVLFGRDFEGQTPDTIRQTLREYQSEARIPLLIAVDEEGGTVCRVSSNPAFRASGYLSPRELYGRGGMDEVLDTETEKAAMLWDLGINVVLGPVCDVSRTPGAFMYSRSIGLSPEETGSFVSGAVERTASFGIGSVLKHFPGYGDNADTHTGVAVDRRSLDSLWDVDLVPFAAGIEAGCGSIMVSHNIVEAMDPEAPASLSARVHDFLRAQMGFTGVIMTDDLDMGAVTSLYDSGEAAVQAVLAGNSMLCTGSYATQYAAVMEAVESGRIPMEVLDSAVTYVLRWKMSLGMIE